jgi:hypothetical protein
VYYLPATAGDVASIAQHTLTYEGRLDLASLGPVMSQFVPSSQQLGKVLTSAVHGLTRHDTYDRFSTALFSKLAIGANGDGEKALELLARIQASKAVKSVNDLYRDLVLDTPATFTDADRAIAHFDNLEDAYRHMETAANKVAVLRDIPEIHGRLVAARRDAGNSIRSASPATAKPRPSLCGDCALNSASWTPRSRMYKRASGGTATPFGSSSRG